MLKLNCSVARVLARPSLMTLYVIFPNHVHFQITPRYVLKAPIHRKYRVVLWLPEKVLLLQKDVFYDIVMHAIFD